jgi:putative copper export protein
MLSPSLETLRLFLHLLGASVWVGGQLVLAGLVPRVRAAHPDALGTIARGFARVAWPALAVTVVTGVWNIAAVSPSEQGTAYTFTLFAKLLAVGVAVAASILHSAGRSKVALAVGGALGLLASLAAMWLGVALAAG